jgi:hypothetical protein
MSVLSPENEEKEPYLAYPSPPEDWKQDDHYLVYGIPTNQNTLVALFASPSSDNGSKAGQVLKLLRDAAGRGAEHIRTIPCLIDPSMQRPKGVLRGYPGGDAVLVVALDWSYEPGLLRRGLRGDEMECLQGYFGGEARWFKSCSTKDRWPIPAF